MPITILHHIERAFTYHIREDYQTRKAAAKANPDVFNNQELEP